MQERSNSEQPPEAGSFYGYGLSQYVSEHHAHHHSAFETARFVMTHGFRYPEAEAVDSLGDFDRAALEVLSSGDYRVTSSVASGEENASLWLGVNALGRLHIRRVGEERPCYGPEERWVEIGFAHVGAAAMRQIRSLWESARTLEREAHAHVKRAMDELHDTGRLARVIDEVIDHVEHVESVCVYVGDRFFALIDRYVNLIDSKAGDGFLPPLRSKPYETWSDDEVLLVAAFHALFISGRSVRFEEFNGVTLSARSLLKKLDDLLAAYDGADGVESASAPPSLFERARYIRERTLRAVGKPWVRYRWIYGLTFQKKERIEAAVNSGEHPHTYLDEFGDDYEQVVSRQDEDAPENVFFTQLACAYLAQDLVGKPFHVPGSAAAGWFEYLMERIVASAVTATRSDYGMSSSIRDMHALIEYDEDKLVETVHKLTPAHFFTCFVSNDFAGRVPLATASAIASSVQRRMMFNRWHFIPGNLDRELISNTRHWYYPPLVPDIAIHSDMHRAGHTRAMVKFSVRAPGPDMSRPPLQIGNRPYRGFYDVRVVRMEGDPFTAEDMLRVRRRTLWLEAAYTVLAVHLQGVGAEPFTIRGFAPGAYRDLAPLSSAQIPGVERTIQEPMLAPGVI